MVQRKVPSKLGVQADHVKSDNNTNKHLPNFKLSSNSQHLDAKNRGADMKKKMKKSRSIKLSDLDEALQTSSSPSPSRKSLPQLGKPPPLHNIPTTSPSPSPSLSPQKQKQHHMVRSIVVGSPNYMKPTSSSHAKKELFPVSLRNSTQSGSPDFKNPPKKFSSDSKANSVVSSKKPAKALSRSSSLSLVRTLTKTTSFKASRSCPRKSTRASSMCAAAHISTTTTATSTPQRATCSSTLKDSKFPSYLMLTPGGTESEGTSAMKVCPYTYCSLNGHHRAALAPLKSFMSQRRRAMKTQKSVKLMEVLSLRSSKIPCEITKEDSDIEQGFYGGKPAYDEIAGLDIFIEIYAKEKEETGAGEVGKIDFHKEIEDQEDIKSKIDEDSCMATEENDDVKQVSPKFEIDLEESFEKSFDDDVAIEVDAEGSFFQEEIAGDYHEEISMGSYCSDEGSYEAEAEHMEDVEMDDSDFKAVDMVWEDEKFHEFDADSSVFKEEDADSKVDSLSESSHDVSIIWLDEILSSYYEDILNEEVQETIAEENNCFEDQKHGVGSVLEGTIGSSETQETGYSSGGISCDQSSFTEKVFEFLINAEEKGGESEKHVDDEAICKFKVLEEEKIGHDQCPNMAETWNINENVEDGYSSQEKNEESIDQANQLFDVEDESVVAAQEDGMLVKDQGKANAGSVGGDEEDDNTKNWKGGNRQKRPIENDDEMRNFNPREPNFLPLVPEPEAEKVDLKHQMMDERKNADDWMIDCALRQVVTKLAPARKKKVALLVEAFETVMPVPKFDTRIRNNAAFAHTSRIQACN